MTGTRRIALAAALTLAAAGLAGAGQALAMTPQEEAVFRRVCTGDYMRLCSMYDPGSPGVQQCFQAKMAELSPGCQGAIVDYNKANAPARKR